MNSNLRNAIAVKGKKAKKDIAFITETDAQIIDELMVALRNMNQDLLLIILNQYKELPDSQILSLIRQFNADYDPVGVEEGGALIKYVEIGGVILQISNIMSIERDQQFNYSTIEMQFRVIINKNAPDNLFLSNKIIFFSSLKQREYELAKLKKVFELNNIKIV